MRLAWRTLVTSTLAWIVLTLTAQVPAVSAPDNAVAAQVVENAKKLLDAFWHLSQDTDKDAEELAAAWSTAAGGLAEWSNLALRLSEENDAHREARRRDIPMPPDAVSGAVVTASRWLRSHAPYVQTVAGTAGMRLARWRGQLCANASDLETMLLSAPLYIGAYRDLLEAIDKRLDDVAVALGKAETLVAVERAEYDLRVTRVMTANAQAAIRRQRAAIERFLLDAAPDPLDVEAGEVLKPFLSEDLHEGVLPDFRFYSESFVEHVETSMTEYEDLYEKADGALSPLLDGSAFQGVPAFAGKSLSQYMKPIELIEEFASERRKAAIASSDLAREIRAALKEAEAQQKLFLEWVARPGKSEYARTVQKVKDLAAQGLKEAQGLLDRLEKVEPETLSGIAKDLAEAVVESDTESYEQLLTDALAAKSADAVRRVRERYRSFRSRSRSEVSSLKRAYDRLRYEAKVLRERIETLGR